MKSLNYSEILSAICKANGKWGMFVSLDVSCSPAENIKAAPYLKELDMTLDIVDSILHDQHWILFDSQEECERYFELTVGDDGPTALNGYDGPARVFALTCNDLGELMGENT